MSERYQLFKMDMNNDTNHYEIYSIRDKKIIAVFNKDYEKEAYEFFDTLVSKIVRSHLHVKR